MVFYIHGIKLKAQNLTKSELHNALENDMNFSHIFSYSLTEKPGGSTKKSANKPSRFYKKLISIINTYVISLVAVFICFAHNVFDVIATMLFSTLTYCR